MSELFAAACLAGISWGIVGLFKNNRYYSWSTKVANKAFRADNWRHYVDEVDPEILECWDRYVMVPWAKLPKHFESWNAPMKEE